MTVGVENTNDLEIYYVHCVDRHSLVAVWRPWLIFESKNRPPASFEEEPFPSSAGTENGNACKTTPSSVLSPKRQKPAERGRGEHGLPQFKG